MYLRTELKVCLTDHAVFCNSDSDTPKSSSASSASCLCLTAEKCIKSGNRSAKVRLTAFWIVLVTVVTAVTVAAITHLAG